ncbi:hypothetical protein [Parabacteroides goldsteinii]|jgi:hypothetical protein|uniref:hypothetical protein n=1 Tax=Parabacteroides goldsteinii TaxID=328812 RepID=UPI0022E84837|nr:hypothetical protein [Parabacteroides goldsteinii]
MKKYPRIYSLSTVGIIHHQENDYIFHPARTDFIGDSGSGKSIIADLLQLIFVGASAFRSATIPVQGKREPDGLVLRSPGKSLDYGYAFVNIEVADGQFITAGAYLESTSKATRPFVVQAGLAIEQGEFSPMTKPLYAADFQDDECIIPLEDIIEYMEEKNLIFKDWQRISFFHKVLYKNKILPLDLTDKDKVLKDYAKIIQSFSRGKELDTTRSSSLLDFLFGQEKGKDFMNKYKSIVEEIEKNAVDYGKNNDEIVLLTQKCFQVSDLYKVLIEKKEAEKKYLTSQYVFLLRDYNSNKENLKKEVYTFLQAQADLSGLQVLVRSELEEAQRSRDKKESAYEEISDIYNEWRQKKSLLDNANKMIEQLNILPGDLAVCYEQYRTQKKEYIYYKELKDKLVGSRVIDLFINSGWKGGLAAGNSFYLQKTDELRNRLLQLHMVEQFHDINNPNSLIRWALSLQRNFTKEEESLIYHFQKYGMNKPNHPKPLDRYVCSPEELLKNTNIEPDAEGFWISLGGINEFVNYVTEKQQSLNNDRETILQYFQSQVANIEQEKKTIEEELELWKKLYDIVNTLDAPARSVDIFFHKPEIKKFQEIEVLNISPEQMEQSVKSLATKDLIEQSVKNAKEEQTLLYNQFMQLKNIVEIFPDLIQKATSLLISISKKIKPYEVEWNTILQEQTIQAYKEDDYINADNKTEFFKDELTILSNTLNKCDELIQLMTNIENQENHLNMIETEYISLYTELPTIDSFPAVSRESVEEAKVFYYQRNTTYIDQYTNMVKGFIPNEQYKFETNHDFKELIANLLPDLFPEDMIIEEEVVGRIKKRLEDINEKNRELNSKKIGKIQDLLTEVKRQVEAQWDEIRRINRFFTSSKKKISGAYNMKLEKTDSLQFPVSWLSQFKHKTTLDNMTDMFDVSILNELNTQVSIREKIMKAFCEITNNNSNDITLEDLLNPNSYIELSLDMKNRAGRNNKGSTGQTYAAIALLCIARLSIVGNKNNAQEDGLRFMPIDEAEGLGSNFDLLSDIAKEYDYQILTFSINPLGKYNEQHVYILNRNPDVEEEVNYAPIEIRSRNDIDPELANFINVNDYGS